MKLQLTLRLDKKEEEAQAVDQRANNVTIDMDIYF